MKSRKEIYNEFLAKDEITMLGGGQDKIDKQHASGKLTARERINFLLDKGSFVEIDKYVVHNCTDFNMDKTKIPGHGVIVGYGKIDGRLVFVYSFDFTVFGGSASRSNANKIIKLQKMSLKMGAPIIGINDSGGARIQEGVASLGGYGEIFYQNTMASGVIPQISLIMGPCAGGACYSPAITDFIFMVKDKSYMFITGPDVVKTVTHEDVSKDELGGAVVHNSKSGIAHFMGDTEEETLIMVRELMSFIPSNNLEESPIITRINEKIADNEKMNSLIPEDPNKPYDIKELIETVVDDNYLFEVMPRFAQNIVIGFARMNGKPIGIVANQPAFLAGVLDIDASDKAARFIRFCDCFNIPLVTFEDVPGFLPGTAQEHNGIIRHGAKVLFAFAEATVPKITIITRKAYGGAYVVMASKHLGADVNFTYPFAEIAVMGASGAVNVLHREMNEEEKSKAVEEYENIFSNPYQAAELGYIDEIIMPSQTRAKIIQALEMTQTKIRITPSKKHGNIPL